ncbi:diacylglycerol/lipid kinase family protein [Legionella gresilensis]|uniref:diacylglycerol/lipid kinase family protein n=1 Tax=Legionella gresilensis TaxID=91823 RepID=UPI0010418628|nr:diacylglycerol kinase family protein [Legionella gresilensis]
MITVFLNKHAAGARGLLKWQRLINKKKIEAIKDALIIEEEVSIELINILFKKGVRVFIAAGGDGTVNCLINCLLHTLTEEQLKTIYFGAIGIGSSNDFHKPIINDDLIAIDSNKAYSRDLLKIDYLDTNGISHTRYAFLNVSLGFCAQANKLFNTQATLLSWLKKINTNLAIFYSIVQTIFTYSPLKNIHISTYSNKQVASYPIQHLGNLHIVKSNHVAGGLYYDNGGLHVTNEFAMHIASSAYKLHLITSLLYLVGGKFHKSKRHQSLLIKNGLVKLNGALPFFIELDGELIQIKSATISVKANAIRCCS